VEEVEVVEAAAEIAAAAHYLPDVAAKARPTNHHPVQSPEEGPAPTNVVPAKETTRPNWKPSDSRLNANRKRQKNWQPKKQQKKQKQSDWLRSKDVRNSNPSTMPVLKIALLRLNILLVG
jgi:hypothetical protein